MDIWLHKRYIIVSLVIHGTMTTFKMCMPSVFLEFYIFQLNRGKNRLFRMGIRVKYVTLSPGDHCWLLFCFLFFVCDNIAYRKRLVLYSGRTQWNSWRCHVSEDEIYAILKAVNIFDTSWPESLINSWCLLVCVANWMYVHNVVCNVHRQLA